MARRTRIGDHHSHGGHVITGASRTLVEGPPSSRILDKAICRIHGIVHIVSGSSDYPVEGQKQARIGSLLSCGAVMVTGATYTETS